MSILSVIYAECRYAECHYAECHYAECRYAECRYAECRGAAIQGVLTKDPTVWLDGTRPPNFIGPALALKCVW